MSNDRHDSTGAMAHAWFGTPMGSSQAIERVFPTGGITGDIVADPEPVIVGYVHDDGLRFMPAEVFHAWRKRHATPEKASHWKPVARLAQ